MYLQFIDVIENDLVQYCLITIVQEKKCECNFVTNSLCVACALYVYEHYC